MSKIVLSDVTSGYNLSTINENFQKIEDELNEKVLYRNPPTGEPNTLEKDLDLNGKNLINGSTLEFNNLSVQNLTINGELVAPSDLAITALPDVSGQEGKFLSNDGITAFWDNDPTSEILSNLGGVNGDSLIGSDDDNSGSLWTTLKGFISYLKSSVGSSIIGFIQDGTGAVQRTTQNKLRDLVSVKDFGAVGDGITPESAIINAAINATPEGGTLDGGGLTYKCNGNINLKSNITLQNITLDFSSAGNIDCITAFGSMEASIPVVGSITEGSATISLSSVSGLGVGDYIFIGSSDYWDNWDDFCTFGEVHRVKSIVGTDVSLFDPILYSTSDGTVAKINTLDGLTLRNVKAIGSGLGSSGDQEGGRFSYCRGLLLDNCSFTKFDDRCVRLTRCLDFEIRGGIYGQANKTGTSYGISINDCSTRGTISSAKFFDLRHGVSFTNTNGPSRNITISNNVFVECREAGIDSHTASDNIIISNNVIECNINNTLSDGILFRSVNANIVGNRIVNPGRYGIYISNNVTGVNGYYSITGNEVIKAGGLYGIFVIKEASGNIIGINISGNKVVGKNVTSSSGIAVVTDNNTSNSFEDINITGNVIKNFSSSGIVVNAANAGSTIVGVVISSNMIRMPSGSQAIYALAVTDGNINRIAITGNVCTGTLNRGIRCVNEEDVVVTGNVVRGASTPVTITAAKNINSNNLI